MIKITKLNGKEMIINSDLIETIEETPDTTVTMTTGKKIIVLEPVDDIIQRVKDFRREITFSGGDKLWNSVR